MGGFHSFCILIPKLFEYCWYRFQYVKCAMGFINSGVLVFTADCDWNYSNLDPAGARFGVYRRSRFISTYVWKSKSDFMEYNRTLNIDSNSIADDMFVDFTGDLHPVETAWVVSQLAVFWITVPALRNHLFRRKTLQEVVSLPRFQSQNTCGYA